MNNSQVQAWTSGQWSQQGGLLDVRRMRRANEIYPNAVLPRHAWEHLDRRIHDVTRTALIVVEDLRARGLVQDLGGLGATVAVWEQLVDMTGADIDMDVPTAGEEDRVGFIPQYTPVPIHHKSFRLSARQVEAARRMGTQLSFIQGEIAARKVRDSMENMTMNGNTSVAVNYEGAVRTIAGLTTQANRIANTATGFGGGDFGTEGNGFKTISGMIGALETDGYYGPYGCYVSRAQATELRRRYTDGSGQTEMTSIMELLPIEFLHVSDVLTAGSVIVFQLTSDVIELAVGLDITPVEWMTMGGLVDFFKVLSALVPLAKSDADGKCGIAHATGA